MNQNADFCRDIKRNEKPEFNDMINNSRNRKLSNSKTRMTQDFCGQRPVEDGSSPYSSARTRSDRRMVKRCWCMIPPLLLAAAAIALLPTYDPADRVSDLRMAFC